MTSDKQDFFAPLEHEDYDDFFSRIVQYKDCYQLTWKDVADIINKYCDNFGYQKRSAEACRKYFSAHKDDWFWDEDSSTSEIDEEIELRKAKVDMSDILTQTNANIRRLAREETIYEIGLAAAESISKMCPLTQFNIQPYRNSQYEAVLQLSDWHYGIEITNPFNQYNKEEFMVRLKVLANRVIQICEEQKINTLHIANLGDMIAGRIHLPIRLNSRVDVITQVIEVSEFLAEFINTLSSKIKKINYYSVIDNHSRLDPNKKDALQLESLERVIDWFLAERFKDCKNITINVCDNNLYGLDIMSFDVLGHTFAGVHGDLDALSKVIENISLMTMNHYDVILSAHLHHLLLNEDKKTVIISNPSLMGTDELAQKLRKNSYAAQNLIIVSKENPVYMLCRIIVDQ